MSEVKVIEVIRGSGNVFKILSITDTDIEPSKDFRGQHIWLRCT